MSGNPATRERWKGTLALAVAVLGGLVGARSARGEMVLAPGLGARTYVTGEGFEGRAAAGMPATSTLVFDRTGALYLARTGRRYWSGGGEADDLAAVYRIPAGGARLTPDTEPRFRHGPPIPNAQTTAVRGGLEVLLTTFDRDRRLGALYRMVDGRATLLAGGTPTRGAAPLLAQPEAVAVDASGRLYVADRDRGAIVRLDPAGRILEPRWVSVQRPRVLAIDAEDRLWIGADAGAEAPWQQGPGEIWRVDPDGAPALVLRGPIPAGIALTPGGHLVVADRQGGQLFALTPAGVRIPLVTYSDGDAPRAVAVAPDTPETRRAGFAGELFVVTIRRGAWPVNDVVRISGPLDDIVRERLAGR